MKIALFRDTRQYGYVQLGRMFPQIQDNIVDLAVVITALEDRIKALEDKIDG